MTYETFLRPLTINLQGQGMDYQFQTGPTGLSISNKLEGNKGRGGTGGEGLVHFLFL